MSIFFTLILEYKIWGRKFVQLEQLSAMELDGDSTYIRFEGHLIEFLIFQENSKL